MRIESDIYYIITWFLIRPLPCALLRFTACSEHHLIGPWDAAKLLRSPNRATFVTCSHVPAFWLRSARLLLFLPNVLAAVSTSPPPLPARALALALALAVVAALGAPIPRISHAHPDSLVVRSTP
jgi:hypothetical protein